MWEQAFDILASLLASGCWGAEARCRESACCVLPRGSRGFAT